MIQFIRHRFPLLALAAVALLAGAPTHAEDSARKYFYEDIQTPFFAPDSARPGYVRSQRPESIESSFSVVKASDAFRVFILGGSIATLLKEERVEESRRAFRRALPGKRVELINCGMSGYETYREALIEQEILEYSPDLILFLTGHNEDLFAGVVPIWVLKAQERLSRWAAYRALVSVMRPGEADGQVHSDERADRRDAAFSSNLRRNIGEARRRGVQVAVVIPPRNYREPLESDLSFYDGVFVPGWLRYLAGDYDQAGRTWRRVLEGGRELSTAHLGFIHGFIGRAEEKLRRWEDARASFERAAALDRAAICGARCQDIIRSAAREEGAIVVEADAMFRDLVKPRMPGLETFDDRMHWRARFNCLMWTEIVGTLSGASAFAGLPWDAASLRETRATCDKPGVGPSEELDDQRTLGYALMDLSRGGLKRASPVTVFYLQAVMRDRPSWFAEPRLLMSRTISPRTAYGVSWAKESVLLPRLYWHLGEVRLLENDRAGAIKNFTEALRLDPSLVWTRVSRAVARGLSGDKNGALRDLKTAIAAAGEEQHAHELSSAEAITGALALGSAGELHDETAAYWLEKAETAAAEGRRTDCLSALDKASSYAPQPPEARLIAQFYRRMKEPRKFLTMSDSLVGVYPGDADLWIARAEAQFELGREREARESLSRAEALHPTSEQRRFIELVLHSARGVSGKTR